MQERRRAARLAARYEVPLRRGCMRAVGTIVSISRTGALLDVAGPEWTIAVGESLRLQLSTPSLIDLDARVVRLTDAGFAVEFLNESVELLELLDNLGG